MGHRRPCAGDGRRGAPVSARDRLPEKIDELPRRITLNSANVGYVVIAVLAAAVLALAVYVIHLLSGRRVVKDQARIEAGKAEEVLQGARREAESILKEAALQAKDHMLQVKLDFEQETRDRKNELSQLEKRLLQKEDLLDKKNEHLEGRGAEIGKKEREIGEQERRNEASRTDLEARIAQAQEDRQRIAGLSAEQAKAEIVELITNEAKLEAGKKIRTIDEDFKEEAAQKARKVISVAVQRYAADYVTEHVVTAVPLPSEEMKGRIIGREGRNIRAFEAATGIDVIIDDTPEAVILSGFNPVRREIARISLSRLVQDGRIHPARIEETVEKVTKEVDETIREAGEQALFDLGIHGVHAELVKLIGKLKYRTSYGQNIYTHSLEVAFLCGMIASELGLNAKVAKRAGLLHDIGKAVDHEVEGPHALIGADLARKYGESSRIVHAIAAHHEDESPKDILPILVQAADALSGARPGARREMLANYLKRLEDLEAIAKSFAGVEKSYAIQAGREVRIIVDNQKISDDAATILARDIAKKVESDLSYPGQIRVTVIRETRAIDYAK
ncbi:MAG: ribonuclease Y [Deltaproteobacteria bacterium]|nr:ribonuclease Y [Deltaproteobacteria bacterium]